MTSIDVEKVQYINGTFQIDGKVIPKKVFVKEVAKYLKTTSEVYGIAQAQAGVAWCYKKGILHVLQDYKDELREKSIGHSLSSRSNSSLSSSNSITTMTEERNYLPNEQRRNSQHSISNRSSNSDASNSSTNTMTNPINQNTADEDHLDESEPFLMDSTQPNEDIEEIRRLYSMSLLDNEELNNHSPVNNDANETRSIHDTTNIILSPPIVPSQANMEIDYSVCTNSSSESLDNEDAALQDEEENKSVIPTPITPESISPQSSAPSSPSTPPRTISLIPENEILNPNNSNIIPVLDSTHYTPQESATQLLSNLAMSTNNADVHMNEDDNGKYKLINK